MRERELDKRNGILTLFLHGTLEGEIHLMIYRWCISKLHWISWCNDMVRGRVQHDRLESIIRDVDLGISIFHGHRQNRLSPRLKAIHDTTVGDTIAWCRSLILCLAHRCVHPAQKLYENTMFFVKNPSFHNPLNETFFSKKYMKTYTAGEKSLSGGLHLTTLFSPKVIWKHIVPEQNR